MIARHRLSSTGPSLTSIFEVDGALCGAKLSGSGPFLNSTFGVAKAFCGGAVCTLGLTSGVGAAVVVE